MTVLAGQEKQSGQINISFMRLEIAIDLILTKKSKLRDAVIAGICEKDQYVAGVLALYGWGA